MHMITRDHNPDRRKGTIMGSTYRYLCWVMFLGLAAVALGCAREPPIVQPPPVEVVVSQPVKEKVMDWDVYTGSVESKESVDIRARVTGQIKDVKFVEGTEIKEND